MTTRTAVLALVAVVLLSGCFGLGGSDGTPTDQATPTATPLPQAPGVGAETIENVTALTEAYRGSTSNVGFVLAVEANGSATTYTYATDGTRLIEREDGSGEIWSNDSIAVRRQSDGGDVTYDRPSVDDLSVGSLLQLSRLEELLTSARYERDGTTACGDTRCVVFTADGSIGGNYRNFTAEIHVDDSGVIHTFDAEYVRTFDDRSFEFHLTVEDLGRSSVDRPDWVEEGLSSTN